MEIISFIMLLRDLGELEYGIYSAAFLLLITLQKTVIKSEIPIG